MNKQTNEPMINFINEHETEMKTIFHDFYNHNDKKLLRKNIKNLIEPVVTRFNLIVGGIEHDYDKPVVGFKSVDKKYQVLYDESWTNAIELKIDDNPRMYWSN